jgi:hypothetical protein
VFPLEEIKGNAEIVIYGSYYLDGEISKGEAEHHH